MLRVSHQPYLSVTLWATILVTNTINRVLGEQRAAICRVGGNRGWVQSLPCNLFAAQEPVSLQASAVACVRLWVVTRINYLVNIINYHLPWLDNFTEKGFITNMAKCKHRKLEKTKRKVAQAKKNQ